MTYLNRMPPTEEWTWDGTYPVRCQIVDVTGKSMHGCKLNTPSKSTPHLGEQWMAELVDGGGTVRITLDDGSVLYGYECWWKAMPPIS